MTYEISCVLKEINSKAKKTKGKTRKSRGAGLNDLTSAGRWVAGGRGAAQSPNIYNTFFYGH